VSCGPGDGCHGGDAGAANQWIAENGITDETCSIYVARGHDNGMPCSAISRSARSLNNRFYNELSTLLVHVGEF
jgi:hypothetical protein